MLRALRYAKEPFQPQDVRVGIWFLYSPPSTLESRRSMITYKVTAIKKSDDLTRYRVEHFRLDYNGKVVSENFSSWYVASDLFGSPHEILEVAPCIFDEGESPEGDYMVYTF